MSREGGDPRSSTSACAAPRRSAMPQPSARRRADTPEPSAAVCAAPSRSAMRQLSASSRSATPQSSASASAAPRRPAIPKPSAAAAGTAPRLSAAVPRPSAPRRSATPPRPSSVRRAPMPQLPQSSASSRSGSATPKPSVRRHRPPMAQLPQSSSAPSRSSSAMPAAFPESVLLDKEVYLGGCCDNETTARAKTSDGDSIAVSFLVADPPALTRCFINCPVMTAESYPFKAGAGIMAADGAFLLIRAFFPHRKVVRRFDAVDFFVYRSGPGTPSLELLPLPRLLYPIPNLSRKVGVLSCGDGEHCLVVDLRLLEPDDAPAHTMHVFSSKTKSWSTKLARLASGMDRYRDCNFSVHKVFGVEGGSIAWVSLREGILLCNSVDQDHPVLQLIQLPSLTLFNDISFGETEIGTMPPLDRIRDVSCTDGWFRFIEIEMEVLGFSRSNGSKFNYGWEATMFKRRIRCSDKLGWKPCGTFSSSGLSPANSACLPGLYAHEKIWDYKRKKLAMNSVISSFPALDMCRDDVVYMLAKVKDTNPNGWVLSINTKSKKLQKIVPFSAKSPLFSGIFLQCGFSKHLSGAPVAAGVCTSNGWKDDIKEDMMPLVPYVTSSLLVQQKLRQLEKYVTHEKPSWGEVKTLIHPGVASTMNVHLHQVTQFATRNGLGNVAFDAVNTFEQASKDIENMLSQHCRNGPSTSAKAVGEKIDVAVEALDELLNMLPSSLLDTGRSMVSVGCMDNEFDESVVEGNTSNICIPAPCILTY